MIKEHFSYWLRTEGFFKIAHRSRMDTRACSDILSDLATGDEMRAALAPFIYDSVHTSPTRL